MQASKKGEPPQLDYANGLHRRERSRIEQALSRHSGNRTRTAQELGIDRTTLWRKMKRFGILT